MKKSTETNAVNPAKRKQTTFKMVILALFIAIMLLMNFSPLGYIYAGTFTITLMTIPVVAGAISLGPIFGLILGGLFGLTSFLQCFGIGYVIDPSAAVLFSISPFATAFTCFVPRMLMGLCVGLLFRLLYRFDKIRKLSYPICAVCGAVFNTLFFMTSYIALFKNTILANTTVMAVILSVLTLNLVIEICVSLVLGGSIGAAVHYAIRSTGKR